MYWYLEHDDAGDKKDFCKEWRAYKHACEAAGNDNKGFKAWYAEEYPDPDDGVVAKSSGSSGRASIGGVSSPSYGREDVG